MAIAGVLAMKPKYLVLDEPTAGLDPRGREEFLEQIAALHKQGMTIIMVSHSMDDIARYAQQMIVLDHGQIKLQGTPQEVFSHPDELEQIGVGVPTLTRLLLRLKAQGLDVRTDLIEIEEIKTEILQALAVREGRQTC